ncbi:hypothetical protein CEE37_15025 [candidate division LCP-89 bacterium B3_LCP]|uniref:Uncharacterized protein n=1 Tax=candidate division LCP-89 bacterium B3_LCP TaxID=2012998 RepID=A0A532UNS2_UNCL8|nr:MAG: hypothetical protein CEE37_15025 [candidate division LCP-89 bacterium B3_LCP]
MNLKKATMLTIISLCYLFSIRVLGTLYPNLFRNLTAAQITGSLSFLASLVILLFFVLLLRDYVRDDQVSLRRASIWAVVVSVAMVLVMMKGLAVVFHWYTIVFIAKSPVLRTVETLIPWVSSIVILVFFVTFYKETIRTNLDKLQRPALAAVIGSSISAGISTYIIGCFVATDNIRWFSDLPGSVTTIMLPVAAVGFFLKLYFFVSFYRELKAV